MHIIPHYFKNCRLYRISEPRPQTLPGEWEDSASMSSKKYDFGIEEQLDKFGLQVGAGWQAVIISLHKAIH